MTLAEWFPLPLQGKEERQHLYQWICGEEIYVEAKFSSERGKHNNTLKGRDLQQFWIPQIVQYLDRARLFLEQAQDTEGEGRRALELRAQQAMAKAMMTSKGLVESSIRVYGLLPTPGVPSGEIREDHH